MAGVLKAGIIVFPLLGAAGGAAYVYGTNGPWHAPVASEREVRSEVKADAGQGAQLAPDAPAAAPSGASNDVTSAVPSSSAAPQMESKAESKVQPEVQSKLGDAKTALADLLPSAPAVTEEAGPRFDVARIEDDGEAVIAGRAAPGARVDLMRDGEKLDSAVADAAGQFVMTPSRLPAGTYNLTLLATSPDGAVAQSRSSAPVVLKASEKAKEIPAARQARAQVTALLAATPPEKGPVRSKQAATPSAASRIVVRGDSLWLISRQAYGVGTSYALIYQANRDKIRNPDHIYPGQSFVVPRKER